MPYQNIFNNYSLKKLNTFGINANAKLFTEVLDIKAFKTILSNPKYAKEDLLILGSGSNILFTKNFDGLIIKNTIKGIEILQEFDEKIIIKVGAGEIWHNFVLYCIDKEFGGIENLSLIPGTVGAAPMQNIGAYGVEIKDIFISLEALNLNTLEIETFNNRDCKFSYRQSIFKDTHKGKYAIVSVTFQLSKKTILNTSYGVIQEVLEARNIPNPTIKDVSDAVIAIRQSKLPNPEVIGNAGSFFKNPIVQKNKFNALKDSFSEILFYNLSNNEVKIPAGWLIENCGWKGKRIGEIGVHDKQALVLVNHGNGKGTDLQKLAVDIQQSIKDKFGIRLEIEVNVV